MKMVLQCRWCNGPVKPPRRTKFPECVHEILIRTNGRYLRDCVNRDKGICKLCMLRKSLGVRRKKTF